MYTREAYLADPEVIADPTEFARISESEATHVLVSILASAGPESPVTEHRFVSNLGGGNNAALRLDADQIRAQAKKITAYWKNRAIIGDPD